MSSARSRSDGMGTGGADEATGAGAITTDAGGRGRGTRGRVDSTPNGWSRGPVGPEAIINSTRRGARGSGKSSVRASEDAA